MDTATERPRFRNDLVAQPIEEEGVRYVNVTDPHSGSTFRFYDVEYSIACAMDGARDIENLAEWTRAELGIEASADELVSVVNTLAELGYLEGRAAAESPPATTEVSEAVPDALEIGATEVSPASYTDEAPEAQPDVSESEAIAGEPAMAEPDVEAPGFAAPPVEDVPEIEYPAPADEDLDGEPEISTSPGEAEPEAEEAEAEIELGPPGRSDQGDTVEAEAATPAPMDENEVSFAGILDEEEQKEATPRPVLRARSSEPGGSLDDEDPTHVPAAAVDDDEDDVSVDLSAHLALDKTEVAEAVRSSRVHEVPELPKELTLEITDEDKVGDDDAMPTRAPAAKSAELSAAELALGATAPIRTPPPPIPEKRDDRQNTRPIVDEAKVPPAVALPVRPISTGASGVSAKPRPSKPIEPTRMPPPASSKGQSNSVSVGIFLALVLLGAAVIAYVFKDQIFGSSEHSSTSRPQDTALTQPASREPTPPPPTAPTPAPLPTAAVRSEETPPASADAKSPSAGSVAWAIADGSTVESGAVLVKLFGFVKVEDKIKEATLRGEFYVKKLEEAKAKNDTASADAAQKKVDEKKGIVDEGNAELEKYLIKAPVAGTVKLTVAQGAAVKPDETVAQVTGAAAQRLLATFDVGAEAPRFKAEDVCATAAKADAAKVYACTVRSVNGNKVEVQFAPAEGAALPVAGDEIQLKIPK